jgi:transcription factor IIIB subunit 2
LDEFKKTESAQLPARDFRTTWLDKSADPPSYAKSIQGKQVEETKAGVKRVNEGEEVTPPTKKIRVVSTLNSDAEEQELADIDDEEIESVILTPEEVKQKTQVWYAENKEYIKERLGKREAEDNKEDRPSTKKRRINQAATPAEAAKQLLSTKKFSAKINPDVFDSMFESPESIEKIKMADRKRKEETGELAEPPDYEVVEEPGFMPFSGEANEGDNGEDDDDDDDDDEDDDIDGGYYDANGEVGVDVVGDNYDYDNDDYYFDAYD